MVGYRTRAHDRPFFEIPWTVDGPYFLLFHDRDLSLDAGWVERLLKHLGSGVRDDLYCRYLASRESTWTCTFPTRCAGL